MRIAYSFAAVACAALLGAAAHAANAAPLADLTFAGGGEAHGSAVVRVGDDGYDGRRYRRYRRGPVVDAPYAYVDAGRPVIVDAPFAHVGVHRNRVRVVAPFVNLSIPR
jgi:hypothetical protein